MFPSPTIFLALDQDLAKGLVDVNDLAERAYHDTIIDQLEFDLPRVLEGLLVVDGHGPQVQVP